jgi:hypothetical protein
MPYFSIETNKSMDKSSTQDLIKRISTFISDLVGKPEQVLMVSIKPDIPLIFAGDDKPAAFVRLKSIGLAKDRCSEFSASICGFVEKELGISQDRVFIDFIDLDGKMFGWNGNTL